MGVLYETYLASRKKYCTKCGCILDQKYEGDICDCCLDELYESDPGEEDIKC